MNTVIKFAHAGNHIVTSNDNIIGHRVAWVITPGSLHRNGEILLFANSGAFRALASSDTFDKSRMAAWEAGMKDEDEPLDVVSAHGLMTKFWVASDIIVPRAQIREFSELAKQGFDLIFWIRNPALDSGSLVLATGLGNEPIRVQRDEPLVKVKSRKTNK